MCDPISLGIGLVTTGASLFMGKQSLDAKKDASREAAKLRKEEAARQKEKASREKTEGDEKFRRERKKSYAASARRTERPISGQGFAENRSFFA